MSLKADVKVLKVEKIHKTIFAVIYPILHIIKHII